jgi:hypothetical protein
MACHLIPLQDFETRVGHMALVPLSRIAESIAYEINADLGFVDLCGMRRKFV